MEPKKGFGPIPQIHTNPHGQVWPVNTTKIYDKVDGSDTNANTSGKLSDRSTMSSDYQSNGAEDKAIGQIEDQKGVQGPNVSGAPFYPGFYPSSSQEMIYGHHPSIPYGGYTPYQHPNGYYGGSVQPHHHLMTANATDMVNSGSLSAIQGKPKIQNEHEGGEDQTSLITPTKEVV